MTGSDLWWQWLNRSIYFILDEANVPVPATIERYTRFMVEHRPRTRVGSTEIGTNVVSTIFLGVNGIGGELALFETMVLIGGKKTVVEVYGTWPDAEAGHTRWVAKVRAEATRATN